MNFSNYFYYDSSSPSGLYRKIDINNGRGKGHVIAKAGDVAGIINKNGYWSVSLHNKRYLAHRIIMFLHGIDCTGKQVDHINQNRTDNRFENLRLVNNSINQKNRKKQKNNTTGINGICTHTINSNNGKTYEYFVVTWVTTENIKKQKRFSINKMGRDSAFKAASEFRQTTIFTLNLQGAGYTELHGT